MRRGFLISATNMQTRLAMYDRKSLTYLAFKSKSNMKRLLLAGAVMMGMSANVQAQPFTQNFNAGIPPTWPMIKADNHIPSSSLVGAIVTKLSNQAWMSWSKGSGDSCAITTSWFTSPAKADRWLLTPSFQVNDPNMVLSWEDYATDGSFADSIQVMIATNAGTTTADFTTTLYHAKGTLDGFSKKGVSLGAYNGQTVRIAFRNNSTDKAVLMLDNVAAAVLPALDGAIEDVAFPRIAASGAVVKVLVSNQGATALTSMTLTYSIDGGTPVSQTFTGLNLLPYAETWL